MFAEAIESRKARNIGLDNKKKVFVKVRQKSDRLVFEAKLPDLHIYRIKVLTQPCFFVRKKALGRLVKSVRHRNYTQRRWKVTSISISIFWKIYYTALWLLLRSCFWSTTYWFGEIKQFHEPWNHGARNARAFYVFSSF